jgi:hypothetical protein
MNCTNDQDSILLYRVAYFGVGVVFDPADWPDTRNSGQSMLLSLGF